MRRRILIGSLVVLIAAIVISAIAVRQIIFGGTPHIQRSSTHVKPIPCPTGGTSTETGSDVFVVDGQRSTASYTVQFQAAGQTLPGTVTGITGMVSGGFTLSTGANRTLERLQITVDLRTLDSGSSDRDTHVREDTFETGSFPFATFTAQNVVVVSGVYQDGELIHVLLPGELTMHGVTRRATFQMQGTLMGDTVSGMGTTVVHIADFGMRNPQITSVVTITIARDVTLALSFTARRQSCSTS